MMRDEFMKSLRPVKRRLRRNRFLRGTATGLAAAEGRKPTRAELRSTDRIAEFTLAPYCFDIYVFEAR